jgi:protein gp37
MASDLPWVQNIWVGVSVESQEQAWRIDELRKVFAAVRFVSAEPLLGPLVLDLDGIDWVIAGGESGPNYRRMEPSWALALRDQCLSVVVAFFFKLLCTTDRCSAAVLGCAMTESDTAAVWYLSAMAGA